MISIESSNTPLVASYEDEIVQEANGSYKLQFKYPKSDAYCPLIRKGIILEADDLHGSQLFRIFEITKRNGYINVYAKQISDDLNGYAINSVNVDRVTGTTVMSQLSASVKRKNLFTFFCDIEDRHTFNQSDVSVMDALSKGAHSIIGQWGGELVRDRYAVNLLKRAGRDTETLFMYKKNLKSYEETDSISNLVSILHLTAEVGDGQKKKKIRATVESSLKDKHPIVVEKTLKIQDQGVKTVQDLIEYGKRYFEKELPDIPKNSLKIDVTSNYEGTIRLFDTAIVFHEEYDKDLRMQITSYKFSPMAIRLKSVGFGKVQTSLSQQIQSAISVATNEQYSQFDAQLKAEIDNANQIIEQKTDSIRQEVQEAIQLSEVKAEEKIAEIDSTIQEISRQAENQNKMIDAADKKSRDALAKVGETSDLANLAKTTSDEALKKAQEVEKNADALSQKANTIEQKVSQQELAISQRITQQDLESKGYVNNNQLTETAAGFERQISQTKGFTEQIGGINRMKFSNVKHGSRESAPRWTILPTYLESVTDTYTFSAIVSNVTDNPDNKVTVAWSDANEGQYSEGQVDVPIVNGRISVTMPPPKNSARTAIMVYPRGSGWSGSEKGEVDWQFTKLELGRKATDWCLAPEEMTIVTKIQEVKSTVDEHTRKFASLESGVGDLEWSEVKQTVDSYKVAIADGGSISRALQTAELVQTEVKNLSIGGRNLILNSNICTSEPEKKFKFSFENDLQTLRGKIVTVSADFDNTAADSVKSKGRNGFEFSVIFQDGTQQYIGVWNEGDGRSNFKGRLSKTHKIKDKPIRSIAQRSIYNQFSSGQFKVCRPKIEFSSISSDWTPAPEDAEGQIQAISTQVTQMAGSWAVKNLTSSGTVLSELNLNNGNIKIRGDLIHLQSGKTLVDNAFITNAMIANLDAGKITSGYINADRIASNTITAEHIKVDSALFDKLAANEAYLSKLFSKQAFITQVQAVDVSATQIKGGVLSALNGNSTFDLTNGSITMGKHSGGWQTSWNSSGIAFRGSGGDIWGAMGGDSGGGVGIYMRGNHAFNITVNHSDNGSTTSYTPLYVKYGEGTFVQFSPKGPRYNLLELFQTIFGNFQNGTNGYYEMR